MRPVQPRKEIRYHCSRRQDEVFSRVKTAWNDGTALKTVNDTRTDIMNKRLVLSKMTRSVQVSNKDDVLGFGREIPKATLNVDIAMCMTLSFGTKARRKMYRDATRGGLKLSLPEKTQKQDRCDHLQRQRDWKREAENQDTCGTKMEDGW